MTGSQATDVVIDQVTDLLHRRIGLRPEPTLRGRLGRCIRDDAAGNGKDVETYLDSVREQPEALQGLVNRVTVQETAFFRHAEHFEVLARDILPRLPRPVTIWSAGCANGQEAYTLAMILDEHGIAGSVIATDISTAALQRTTAARYGARELTGLSPERTARHLTRVGHGWEVNASIRERVTIVRHNLLDPIPAEVRSCHVVFCRNVLIYFAPECARAFLDGLADSIPEAALFLGSAETIWPLSDRFDTVHVDETFFYRHRADRPNVTTKASRPAPPAVSRRRPRAAVPSVRPADKLGCSTPKSGTGDVETPEVLARAGQRATAEGDHKSAVIAFRKCAYVAPNDPMTHLHLALALEAAGDHAPAQRAYAAARRALLAGDPAQVEVAAEGYTTTDLLRLLDTKLQVAAR
jgi:chemotaxis methyl-accepting protein methylase